MALFASPVEEGVALEPPDKFSVRPVPYAVVPLVPSSEAISARIESTLACGSACPLRFIFPEKTFRVPIDPSVTEDTAPRPLKAFRPE